MQTKPILARAFVKTCVELYRVWGASPCRSVGRIFFSRMRDQTSVDPFHPHVTAVAQKDPVIQPKVLGAGCS